jgi:hypothetical protein
MGLKHAFYTLLISAALAFVVMALYISATMPRGEGSFAIAGMMQLGFIIGFVILTCVLWFPSSLALYFWRQRKTHEKASTDVTFFVRFSAVVCIGVLALITLFLLRR